MGTCCCKSVAVPDWGGDAALARHPGVVRVLRPGKGDADAQRLADEWLDACARGFAGDATTPPEASTDWMMGTGEKVRPHNRELYTPLGGPPTEERLAAYRYAMGWGMRYAMRFGVLLGAVDEATGRIAAGMAILPPADYAIADASATMGCCAELRQAIAMGWPPSTFMSAEVGARSDAFSAALRVCHEAHATMPHWYVVQIGVRPDAQGRGLGGRLMRCLLDIADAAPPPQAPVYLETVGVRNERWYEGFGFRLARRYVLRVPGKAGDRMAPMDLNGGAAAMLRQPGVTGRPRDTGIARDAGAGAGAGGGSGVEGGAAAVAGAGTGGDGAAAATRAAHAAPGGAAVAPEESAL